MLRGASEVDDDDEYETEEEEEELSSYPEGDNTAAGSGDGAAGAHKHGTDGKPLASLPPLSEHVLTQRRGQLVEALVVVLGGELQRFDQRFDHRPAAGTTPPAATAAAAAGGLGLAAGLESSSTASSSTPATHGVSLPLYPSLNWRSSLAVCSTLVSLLAASVSPEKPAPSYQLLIEKAATQEEFIPGQLPSGGLVTSGVLAAAAAAAAGGGEEGPGGPLMRDVKNYICGRLDMSGRGWVCKHGVCLWGVGAWVCASWGWAAGRQGGRG